jgi:endo-1,4-beta-D-glucanase Y
LRIFLKRPARLFLVLAFYGFAAAAYSQAINGTAGSYPFPNDLNQNLNNPFGFHTSASSSNGQEIVDAYNKWYADCITSYGAGGYLRILRPNDSGLNIDSTVSEGIGYAMVIAVYMNDQNLFDNIWKYEQLHVDANGLMNWYIDASGASNGTGGATDADEDMAWALLMAVKQWGGSGTLGSTYQSLAVAQINRIYSTETSGQTIIGGDSFPNINPSYFDPAYYREFEKATGQTGWTNVAANCYTVLNNNLSQGYGNAANGLDSAWCTSAGVSTNTNNPPYNYQYDACRTPFRIAEDYVWFGTTTAQTYLGLTSAFFSAIGVTAIVDGYQLNGTPAPQLPTLTLFQNSGTQSAAFVGPAGVGGMVSRTYQSYIDNTYADLVGSKLLVGGTYYDESWTVMSLLMLSDNFLDYNLYPITGATPTATPAIATFTATATPTTPTYTAFSPIYVNCGGPQYVSASTGITWLADQAYTAGSWGYTGTTTVGTTTNTITGTVDPTLYKTDRYAASEQYIFTVPAGVYNITLKFAETAFNSAAQRIFAVSVGNEIGISDLDIWSVAGGENIAKDYTIPVTTTGAPLTISLVADVNYASINALSVVEQAQPPTSTATQTATSTVTNTATHTATNTPSNTVTNTPTDTSITSTFTNTATNTASSTATSTLTNTVTNTATNTDTNTATNTATLTVTNTATNTATNSPTGTPPPTNTATNTFTNTSSSTATNTLTNTASETATHSPTSTATNSATHTASTTSTNTATQTVTNTATHSPTITSTQTATNTMTNTPTITATLTATRSPTNTATNSATHTATNTATVTSTSSKTNTPTVTSSNTPTGTPTSTYTPQPTLTPTNTSTITPTYTPTISQDIVISQPFPNPSNGSPITFNVQVPDQSTVTLDVFTLAFRKIYDETKPIYGSQNLYWNLKDRTGIQVADGLYYVRVHVAGSKSSMKILKVLILR